MYASFNDSEVRILAFPWFGSGSISGSFKGGNGVWTTFPESRTVRYPTVRYGIQLPEDRFGHCIVDFLRKAILAELTLLSTNNFALLLNIFSCSVNYNASANLIHPTCGVIVNSPESH
jgi:hypothetical protein